VRNQNTDTNHVHDAHKDNESAINANAYEALSEARAHDQRTIMLSPTLSHAFCSDNDRRKRRKLSVETEQVSEGQSDTQNLNETTSKAEDPVREQHDLEVLPLAAHHEAKPDMDFTQVSSNTPKKRRGRPPRSTAIQQQGTPKLNELLATDSAEDKNGGLTLTPSKAKRTSRKKTMQVSAKGTLFQSSPPEENVAPQKSNIEATKSAQSSTKMTLRKGKFTQTLIVILKYTPGYAQPESIGAKLQSILSEPHKPRVQNQSLARPLIAMTGMKDVTKTTHPFFLGKAGQKSSGALTQAPGGSLVAEVANENGVQQVSESKRAVPWSDIVFKSNKPFVAKDFRLEKPAWPPLEYQHIGGVKRPTTQSTVTPVQQPLKKSKARQTQVSPKENVLNAFDSRVMEQMDHISTVSLPQRLHLSSHAAIDQLQYEEHHISDIPAVKAARQKALQSRSAFDRAEPAGPLSWPQQYGPSTWEEVLQPSCNILYDWLKSLAVHNVKQGLEVTNPTKIRRRKRQKKKENELDDFIVSDDEPFAVKKTKNAILIVGPNGCGKTAAVYAVAKQLGFEVFEINPGMRRSQKDIFDRVGDMAQNHMVQGGDSLSRDSSVLHDVDGASSQEDSAQSSVTNYFAQPMKKALINAAHLTTPQSSKQEQKQSLILFEEVDHIFEDDRGFWSGVQSLIQNSKRPVVLTCNDLHNIPLNDLDVHEILTFAAPPPEVVAQYVTYIAAAEGHLIQPDAVRTLYINKGNDLRATMTELDFWCQMTVGSTKGGLDWYPSATSVHTSAMSEHNLRIFSKQTFQSGLELLPTTLSDLEDGLRFAEDCLDLPPDLFFDELLPAEDFASTVSKLEALSLLEFRSDGEIIDPTAKRMLYTEMYQVRSGDSQTLSRHHVLQVIDEQRKTATKPTTNFGCLLPLAHERPVFPPAQGRLAPTLDSPRSILAVDIAPYVRSIAAFDQRLEQSRDELFSSQGKKSRTTRAARAAAEGGDKASTRRERWFPKDLDLEAVLVTGNDWPQWLEGQVMQEDIPSPISSAVSAIVTE